MGHPGDSYVLRAGKNKDILLDIPTGQGEFHIVKDTFTPTTQIHAYRRFAENQT